MQTLLLLAFLLAAGISHAADQQVESDWPFIAGDYEVIGRACASDVTYCGYILIREEGGKFIVTRRLAGKEVVGRGSVEFVTPDKIPVFRIRFKEDGVEYIGTYSLNTDLDNDGRLSGYVTPLGYSGPRPGKEVMFALKEIEKKPNKALEPTTMAVTPPAAQVSRQP